MHFYQKHKVLKTKKKRVKEKEYIPLLEFGSKTAHNRIYKAENAVIPEKVFITLDNDSLIVNIYKKLPAKPY